MNEHPTPLYLEFFGRLLALDRPAAMALVDGYLAEAGDVAGLYTEVLRPTLIHTGEEWAADRISVAHEHYISEVTRDLIARLGPTLWVEPGDDAPVVLAGCAPGERHALGLLMVCDVLRSFGMVVHPLGEGAPAESIRDLAADLEADVLSLSVALDENLPAAGEVIRMAREARPSIVVLVGGAAFGGDARKALALGADQYAPDARALAESEPALRGRIRDASSKRVVSLVDCASRPGFDTPTAAPP